MFRYQLYVTSPSLLQWAVDELGMPLDRVISAAAAENGDLDVLKWARAQDPPCDWDAEVCSNAARYGHLDVLQWARAQDPPCDWSEWVCSFAARNGHLDVIEWLRTQNLPASWHLRDD